MKKPAAAATEIPLEPQDGEGSSGSGLKRPAAAAGLKCSKYMYHKQGKYGIKVNGKEMLTAGAQQVVLHFEVFKFLAFNALFTNYYPFYFLYSRFLRLSHKRGSLQNS